MWSVGDRVLGQRAEESYWYPGTIKHSDGERYFILFDDGNQLQTPAERLRPLTIDAGDKVQGRWQGGPQYYPGEITERTGDVVHVRYDDGDEETTLLRLLRLERDDWLPAGSHWSEGDR